MTGAEQVIGNPEEQKLVMYTVVTRKKNKSESVKNIRKYFFIQYYLQQGRGNKTYPEQVGRVC